MTEIDIASRQFGFEVEFHRPSTSHARLLLADAGFVAEAYQPPGRGEQGNWETKSDGSVAGAEIASPVLDIANPAHRELVSKMCAAIKAANDVRLDERCGLHVHVDVSDLGVTEICNAVATYYSHQQAIDRLVGRKRTRSTYSKSMTFHSLTTIHEVLINRHPGRARYNHDAFIGRDALRNRHSSFTSWGDCPRTAVNVQCFPRIGTVEFRQHYTTLDPKMLLAWIGLMCGIVNTAAAGQGSWSRNAAGSRKRLLEFMDDATARYYTNWRPTKLPSFVY